MCQLADAASGAELVISPAEEMGVESPRPQLLSTATVKYSYSVDFWEENMAQITAALVDKARYDQLLL